MVEARHGTKGSFFDAPDGMRAIGVTQPLWFFHRPDTDAGISLETSVGRSREHRSPFPPRRSSEEFCHVRIDA